MYCERSIPGGQKKKKRKEKKRKEKKRRNLNLLPYSEKMQKNPTSFKGWKIPQGVSNLATSSKKTKQIKNLNCNVNGNIQG